MNGPTLALNFADRKFQVWCYSITHSMLLLRSTPDDEGSHTRIDVLFENVQALRMETRFFGLEVREMEPDQALILKMHHGLELSYVFYALQTSHSEGYVIASTMKFAEDDLDYTAPSQLWPRDTPSIGVSP